MDLVGETEPILVTRSEWTTQRWKNGAGVTHEIMRWSRSAPVDDSYDVRISVAEIDGAQPFSSFPGYYRTLVVLEPVVLRRGSLTLSCHARIRAASSSRNATSASLSGCLRVA